MTTFSHITVDVVRTVLEAGRPEALTGDLINAAWETYSAWDADQNDKDITHRALEARGDAIDALDELGADNFTPSSNVTPESLARTWDAMFKYWSN
jgi:hypothetical protein